ncbi:Senecionine N-oxygenase [Friedmanniomyces endolithicus]|uniref:glutaminase n=1 Tax=Friedmanniomyces endolithicus TaxID=329885 RepID=A0AAN6KJX7_9PEZI|nr:Senecionine N-oxygenase [Friedmanniomyces endolithicus]KAK0827288.1 Senecionine N-oxygenase [Friedmanniomyces endolithicus]KAK0930705.1 Senecionine N-oxygenase [Friedmanniomyces endolithicus]KAK0985727.1 Senecionine N-oxygenase [Friedmanniomyces endolithicus]KAK1009029.1 Senecionine N-oxygenase [Friedmanniomyces endolithicus]
MTNLTVGVLALQGAFIEHLKLLRQAADDWLRQQHQQQPSTTTTTTATGSSPQGASPSSHASPRTDADRWNAAADADADADADAHILIRKPNTGEEPTAPTTTTTPGPDDPITHFTFLEIRTPPELARCDALILPGGESTSISLIAARTGLLEPLREFVKVARKPVWGTCAGLILLAESANETKATGQELIGGLDVRVQRNYFGRQVESFEAELQLPFLQDARPFHSVFIRAPVVEKVLAPATTFGSVPSASDDDGAAPALSSTKPPVEILGRLPGRAKSIRDKTATAEDLGEEGDIIAVRQGNVFGTAFHPELTGDGRIHRWWLGEVMKAKTEELNASQSI